MSDEEVVTRESALRYALSLLMKPYLGTEDAMLNAVTAHAWLVLGESLKSTPVEPPPQPDMRALMEQCAQANAAAAGDGVKAAMSTYRELLVEHTDLKTRLRALADDFGTRAQIADEPVLQDVAYMLLGLLDPAPPAAD